MTLRAMLARASAMDAQELRTRVASAVRTNAGRVRFAVARPQWKRTRLLTALDASCAPLVRDARRAVRAKDFRAAHGALAEHVRTRASRWPLKAARQTRLARDINRSFPAAAETARQSADRILDGWFDLLGYRNVFAGSPPVWQRDPVHGRLGSTAYWADVRYLDPTIGDHKVIWEINRHQHFLALGAAFWLTGDARYREGFVNHLEDWIVSNPPGTGINWASMLELAFRALSWTWAVEFFGGDRVEDSSPWLVDLLVALDLQLDHIARNLSTYFSPNTHLSGEALALYAVSVALPEFARSGERAALGREVLVRESRRQVLGDGGHAELSAHYHRYSTDFYLLACMVARAAGDDAAAIFERTAHRQAAYLRTIADDEGRLPMIGDDDGGRLFRFDEAPASEAASTLAVAAALLSDGSLAVTRPGPEVCWILGERPRDTETASRPAVWPSRLLSESGYFVSRTPGGGHLVFDAGRHGFLNGGHAHSDALSVVLTVNGLPVLIDAGTATYTMDRAVRDRHRAARMHNTLVLDERDPSAAAGPFHWRSRTDARVLVARPGREFDFAAGALCGRAAAHVRAVLTLHGTGWLIVDRVHGGAPVTADVWWHLHPMWQARACEGGVALECSSGARRALAFSGGDVSITQDPDLASVSLEYGRLDPATTIRIRHRGAGPFALAAFVPDARFAHRPIRVDELEAIGPASSGWHTMTFAIHSTAGLDLIVELPFPDGREPEPDEPWPQPCIHAGRATEVGVCAE